MPIPRVSQEEFLALFDPDLHAQILEMLGIEGVTAVVAFENKQMDSSRFGSRASLIVGPFCTFRSVDDCDGKWLNDLPSQRMYPIAAHEKGMVGDVSGTG